MLDSVELRTFDEPVVAPAGIVYSTQPRTATGDAGEDYFVKGPDVEVVFAELAGCLLAQCVGATVPPVAVCRFEGEAFCGSRRAAGIGRNALPWLTNPGSRTDLYELYAVIVIDTWL